MKTYELRLFRLYKRETGFYFVLWEFERYTSYHNSISVYSLFSINRYNSIIDSKPRTYIKFFHIEKPDNEYRQ